MRKNNIRIISVLMILLSIITIQINAYGHSGRTDSNGGHKDNKNKSGLGSYHYHCGGYPAHLHTNGVCPYSTNSSSTTKTTTTIIPTTVYATEIKINENVDNIEIGESKKLTATITPSNTTNKNIIWKSSDESIITINSTGEIIAKKAGVVDITANTSNGKTSTITINVKEDKKTENNTIIKTSETNNPTSNITNNKEKNSNTAGGILIVLILGASIYWIYKKSKKQK